MRAMPRLPREAELEPDDVWLEKCRQGDDAAWNEYFTRYHGFVRGSARRLGVPVSELDDVEQDVFTVAFRHLRHFKQGRMKTWLFHLVSNVVSNRHRARRIREGFLALFGRQPEAPPPVGAHERWEANEAQAFVHGLLAKLSPKKRDVFALFELEGMKGEAIAELLGIGEGTVWTRLHHARKDFEALARKAGVAP
jgi:RNA polymerase sigma-70 factor, ECF subfamily